MTDTTRDTELTTDQQPRTDIDTDTDRSTDAPEYRTDGGTIDEESTPTAKPILLASLEESMGKTAITLALAKAAADDGDSVGYMKPKGTRLQSNVGKTLDEDPMLARELLGLDAEMHDLEPVVYSPTFIEQAIRGRENSEELRSRVQEAYDDLAAGHDRMYLEGGGRLEQGGIVDLTDADIADILDARVVLVAPYETPGDIDDVLAAADLFGDRLDGVIFNAVADSKRDRLESEIAPFLEGRGVPVHGVLPREQELAGVTVGDLADEIGGEILAEDGLDAYVERFAVGAMGADSALRHFRRTKNAAVITGGDRADIHSAALEASGVKCLILTGGHRPSGTILGQAAQKNVPVIMVQTDTLSTVERAEEVIRSGRTRDEATIDLMQGLLADHADLEALR